MTKDILRLLYEPAVLFRKTIEEMEINEFPKSSFFDGFPKGCCGDTSDLLSKYYLSRGIHTQYVWGIYKDQSHAWLEYGDIIIDITADQFDDVEDKVIVTKDRTWHSKFTEQNRTYNDFDKFNPYNAVRLRTIYSNILKRIN